MNRAESDDFDSLKRESLWHDLLDWLGVGIRSIKEGHVQFEVPFDEKFTNLASGTVHGDVTAAIIETASGFALRTTFEIESPSNGPQRTSISETSVQRATISESRQRLSEPARAWNIRKVT